MLTNDITIDRRIFFFADVLREHGYEITLFGERKTPLDLEQVPNYVCRPDQEKKIWKTGIPIDQLPPPFQEIIKDAKDTAENEQRIGELRAKKYRRKEYHIQVFVGDGYYTIQAAKKNQKELIRFNSLTNNCILVYDKKYQLGAMDVLSFASQYQEESLLIDPQKQVLMRQNSCGHREISLQKSRSNTMTWTLDLEEGSVSLHKAIPKYNLKEKINFKGQEYDYRDFRKYIHDFSSVLQNVEQHLTQERPDLLYVADLPMLPVGLMVKQLLEIPLIMDCHEWWYKQGETWSAENKKMIKLSKKYEKELYPQCDLIITVGKYLAKEMSSEYKTNFEKIYSCVSTDFAPHLGKKQNDFYFTKCGIPIGSEIAVFQGNLTTKRNLETLARATRYLKENQYLVFVGDGYYMDEVNQIVQNEGAPERVRFTGRIVQRELLDYTINADLGVIPYIPYNAYMSLVAPNKLFEYFNTGIPILYEKTMREEDWVVGENHVGVAADLTTVESFGKALSALLSDKKTLAALKENYKYCQGKYSFCSEKKELERMLLEHQMI